ncbi:uncharacterized protein N7479_008728 [Penicillium vulpinum]|uniref:uncharacterized protein n=1 Tax=Penicillium vulpinum TaxID=29845 RepID=UPI002546CEAA|nr:uncharacterized protein N7479_008728 [Penicillium vulpinum]KAJ5950315.1 hypothetical protein N7479_008728 [Penicillium vulpinum]
MGKLIRQPACCSFSLSLEPVILHNQEHYPHYLCQSLLSLQLRSLIVNEFCRDWSNLFFCQCATIVKMSSEVAVKIGAHVNFIEAKNMIYPRI